MLRACAIAVVSTLLASCIQHGSAARLRDAEPAFQVPQVFDPGEVRARVEATYQAEVAAVLPHSDDMMALASAGIFALRCPDHAMTTELRRVAAALVA